MTGDEEPHGLAVFFRKFQARLNSFQRPQAALNVTVRLGKTFPHVVKKQGEVEKFRLLDFGKDLREFFLPGSQSRRPGEFIGGAAGLALFAEKDDGGFRGS